MKDSEFDDIRPYRDEEVTTVIERLMNNEEFTHMLKGIIPSGEYEAFIALIRSFTTTYDFQHGVAKQTVYRVVTKTATGVDASGLEHIEKDKAYTYISNHRDIVLDAALISSILGVSGYDTVEIAIGDNLLIRPWIEDLVKLNKSFIVKRGISMRQILEASMHMSRYIHHTIDDRKQSVWIAQREGRSKDSNDRTQDSVLKMLAMGGDKDFLQSLESLNISPTALSYEYDPCDYLKAQEFQLKRDNPEYKKTKADDMLNMSTGINGFKGRIHFHFGESINPQLAQIDRSLPKNEQVTAVASLIDKEIFLHYHFYPINYVAYDTLWGDDYFNDKYTDDERKQVQEYVAGQVSKISIENKDEAFLTEKIWEMYANPVKNYLSVKA